MMTLSVFCYLLWFMVISYTISKAHKVNSANNNLLSGRWTKAIQLEEATENDKREIPQKFHI